MTTSSEDVLLQMGEVRFKKGDGTIYVMNERVAWMAEHRDTVAVSHKFQDIKLQKISPDGKPKVQLQIVLHDGNSSTFHFVNKLGLAAQLADRDQVKQLLQQLLPNFKRKVDKELEEKNRILSENPHLLQLYKDLVITQVLTSEEFWSTHAKDYAAKANQTQAKQAIGVSGAFLADIKPQTDGCNGFRYNLTGDIIECIFKTYPAVKRKHVENVPAKMTESEFWTKFFQSHYFHRDRIAGTTKDIFAECGRIDDQALRADVAKGAGDPLLDLRLFEDNTLEEGFGGAVEPTEKAGASGNIVHQNMIKRFNQHSMMVLKTCADVVPKDSSGVNNSLNPSSFSNNNSSSRPVESNGPNKGHKTIVNGSTNGSELNNNSDGKAAKVNGVNGTTTPMDEPQTKRARIMEKIQYDDLMGLGEDEAESSAATTTTGRSNQLNLMKVERYLHGPMPGSLNPGLDYGKEKGNAQLLDLNNVQANICGMTDSWAMRTPHKALVNATAAVNALGELSPGGALMRGFQEQSLAQLVPPDVEKELRDLYLAVCELLRHFWKTFPPTTPELEAKAERMYEALQRFQMAKLKPFEERALREFAPLGTSLTQHLNQLLLSAQRKYSKWQEIRMRQMR